MGILFQSVVVAYTHIRIADSRLLFFYGTQSFSKPITDLHEKLAVDFLVEHLLNLVGHLPSNPCISRREIKCALIEFEL